MFLLAVLAREAIWKVTLIAPWVTSEAGKGFNGEELDISLGGIPSGLPLMHLHPTSVVEWGRMMMGQLCW